MKVILGGAKNRKPWWEGKLLECEQCGQVVQLERGDEDRADTVLEANEKITMRCGVCETLMHLTRERGD
jgi:hypothetical protein